MKNMKLGMAVGIVVLVLVLIFQNMQAVDTKLLFMTITMPRALLLVIVFALGALTGMLMCLHLARGKSAAKATE